MNLDLDHYDGDKLDYAELEDILEDYVESNRVHKAVCELMWYRNRDACIDKALAENPPKEQRYLICYRSIAVSGGVIHGDSYHRMTGLTGESLDEFRKYIIGEIRKDLGEVVSSVVITGIFPIQG